MKKLTFSAAAIIAVAGVLASASANAEHNAGGPIVKGDQCFSYVKGQGHDARFGSWHACPQTASATRTTTTNARGRNAAAQPAAGKPTAGGGESQQAGKPTAGGGVGYTQNQQGYWGF